MSYTPEDYADGVWTHPTRTVDAGSPAPSDGSYIDDVAYAVWTYATRTASGGVATFSINVAETMPAPSQSITLQTVMPVIIAQTMPTPEQAGIATFIGKFEIAVSQEIPAPSQSGVLGTGSTKKKRKGGYDYYPPIYTIRMKGKQAAPPPSQGIRVNSLPPQVIEVPEPIQPTFVYSAKEQGLVPAQSIALKSHRSKKIQREEEEQIIMLLMGVS